LASNNAMIFVTFTH